MSGIEREIKDIAAYALRELPPSAARENIVDKLRVLAEQVATPSPDSAAGEVERLKARITELESALDGVLPFMEAAETAGLVGDEGCLWPVEAVRDALAQRAQEGR